MPTAPITLAATDLSSYLPILILVGMAVTFGVFNVVASNLLGPSRTGKVKEKTYESGMDTIGSAHKRFNVRFYIIAMVFLVFDIEIIFLYPWAVTFPNIDQSTPDALLWLGRILFFVFTTVVAYVYGVRKGVFRFD
ncbi:MAG: NADH-quinone oxidoreductase subunit A [Phycisphaeraceae bacterium]|nr:NADH-quinone oxidoreductase subunit A [Phycisphaeraceae bacterium]